MRCRQNAVNFLIHKIYRIARPLGGVYVMSFVDSLSASGPVIIYSKSYNIVASYNGTRLQLILNSLMPNDAYIPQYSYRHCFRYGLSPGRRQATIWNNAGILSSGFLGTNFSEILIEILTFSFKKMRLNVSSAKWRPFSLGLNVLKRVSETTGHTSNKISYTLELLYRMFGYFVQYLQDVLLKYISLA